MSLHGKIVWNIINCNWQCQYIIVGIANDHLYKSGATLTVSIWHYWHCQVPKTNLDVLFDNVNAMAHTRRPCLGRASLVTYWDLHWRLWPWEAALGPGPGLKNSGGRCQCVFLNPESGWRGTILKNGILCAMHCFRYLVRMKCVSVSLALVRRRTSTAKFLWAAQTG